jgi:hypothetical protein
MSAANHGSPEWICLFIDDGLVMNDETKKKNGFFI